MMNQVGTAVLDGIIQGILSDPQEETDLLDWVQSAATLGISFVPETTAGHFSLLADNRPLPVEDLGGSTFEETLVQILTQLGKQGQDHGWRELVSTLRSSRFEEGEEIQTMYVFSGEGEVQSWEQRRTVKTTSRARSTNWRQPWWKPALTIVLGLALLVTVLLMGDWLRFIPGLQPLESPASLKSIKVDNDRFEKYFEVTEAKLFRYPEGKNGLRLKLRRTDAYPLKEAAPEETAKESNTSPPSAIRDALMRDRIHFELYDVKRELLEEGTVNLRGLRKSETITVRVRVWSKRSKIRHLLLAP